MRGESKGISREFTFVAIFVVLTTIIVATSLVYYSTITNAYNIDYGDGLPEPHLTGNSTIEVDYMDGLYDSKEDLQDELDEVTVLFAEYGINVTFIVDDEVSDLSEIGDSDVLSYYEEYRDENCTSYMIFAYNNNDVRILGSAFSRSLSVIYKDRIDDTFQDSYKIIATKYVVMHEIGHCYGLVHSEVVSDIMYPQLSIEKCLTYPTPQFTDSESVSELND